MSISFAVILTGIILVITILLVFALLINRRVRKSKERWRIRTEKKILQKMREGEIDLNDFTAKELLSGYNSINASTTLEKELDERIVEHLMGTPLVKSIIRRISSPLSLHRIEAVAKVRCLIKDEKLRNILLEALKKEKSQVVALYMFEALARVKETRAIIPMIGRLGKSTRWMERRYRALLITYADKLLPYLLSRLNVNRIYMNVLITDYAQHYPREELREYLIEKGQTTNIMVRKQALTALARFYPQTLITPPFTDSPYRTTAPFVIRAYATLMDPSHIPDMLAYAHKKSLRDQLVLSLSEMATRNPAFLFTFQEWFEKGRNNQIRGVLARVLNNRIAYLIESSKEGFLEESQKELVQHLIAGKHVSGLMQFLNTTRDEKKQEEVLKIFASLASTNRSLRLTLFEYLHPAVYEKLGLPAFKKKAPSASPHMEKPQRMLLILLFILTLISLPLIILFKELPNMVNLTLAEIGRLYVVRFNYLLVYYSVTIASLNMLILVISFQASRTQNRLWRAKDLNFLFTPGLLPAVSIIAPAFNEEANIIESTNSLLNQAYPEFELIVVNDGSRDGTLRTLIEYFDLEKQDRAIEEGLPTRPLRGIYTNRNIPNLVVVDKVNGGKADSLNLGLNVARKEFFCGIDADSLLEPDALLKAVSVMLDSQIESIASGGNICPVNGCEVELGSIGNITLPRRFLARFQSLEYIRSFMTGRMGWAKINLLLIISGAFGIFHRKRTIATGGYLTKSGKFHKDTVGEDMELVVRLSRFMREKKTPYKVQYAGNANCWTEVPESFRVLRRQRDRWQRGLIDIVLFHNSMIANPRYGKLGMVAMPYYFIFELIGPFIEAEGIILVVFSAVLGLLNFPVVLALFTATILMGIMVSLTSLVISDFDRPIYSSRDIGRLLALTIIENFGTRQLISLLRVGAYFSAMRKNRGWGAQVRKGFRSAKAQS